MIGVSRDIREDENFVSGDVINITEEIEQSDLENSRVHFWIIICGVPFITGVGSPEESFVRIVPVRPMEDPYTAYRGSRFIIKLPNVILSHELSEFIFPVCQGREPLEKNP